MKFFATFILSVVLVFSIVPCCTPMVSIIVQESIDISSMYSDNECCKENSTNTKHSEKEEKGCRSCSPFFSCGTCSGFTFFSSVNYLTSISTLSEISYYLIDMQIESEYFDTKWQPPKIG